MFYLIEYCTDLRDPRNKITKSATEAAAKKALKKALKNYKVSVNTSNNHVFLVSCYEVKVKAPSTKWICAELQRLSGSIYSPRNSADVLSKWIIDNACRKIIGE